MKQTAIDWLIEQLKENNMLTFDEWTEIIEQAKTIEKEQIVQAITKTIIDSNVIYDSEYPEVIHTAEQYYNETFKSENIVMFMTPENGEIESIILTDNPDCGVKGITFKSE